MRCKSCQYSLNALSENRCPECGRVFDPNDPKTFHPPVPVELPFQTLFYFGLFVLFAILYAVCYLGLWLAPPSSVRNRTAEAAFLVAFVHAFIVWIIIVPVPIVAYLVYARRRHKKRRADQV